MQAMIDDVVLYNTTDRPHLITLLMPICEVFYGTSKQQALGISKQVGTMQYCLYNIAKHRRHVCRWSVSDEVTMAPGLMPPGHRAIN